MKLERKEAPPVSDWVEMIYDGPDSAPFSIRGESSKRVYWRVRRGDPFPMLRVDEAFMLDHGFRKA